ncbi:hypothetical protein GCM10009765_02960 [Fodinicola feengrottensis]|uniref:IrrE N-terminal-like domain-containing protein n=2 Tax=Fodinicola feengrottensis TaxID=435914 RepID=A0ABP4RN59_9ACTN
MFGQYTLEAQTQAEAMLAFLERDRPGVTSRLRYAAVSELETWPDVCVEMVDESVGEDRCSVAGSYHPAPPPPTLRVGRAASHRRRGFTALHELGHHLQQTDPLLGERTFEYSDPNQFQEEACDAFAAHVLLADEELRGLIGARGPTAQDVVEIFSRTQASREACCVWAAQRLAGAGAVVLLDGRGTVLFAAARTFVPPARRSDQSGTPLIEAALLSGRTARRDRTFVSYRNGSTSDDLYGDAVWCDVQYLIAVLALDNAGWHSFAPSRPFSGTPGSPRWWTCATCDEGFKVAGPPCVTCRQPECQDGHCGCTTTRMQNDRRCNSCFLVLAPTRFEGSSLACLDCA